MKMRYIIFTLILISFVWMPDSVQAQNVTQDLLGRINGLRADLGLAPYTLNAALSAAAQSHAQWMADSSQVTHIQDNGSSPQTRANANGYNSVWVSENIYMGGLASVDTAWNFWINSSIHYAGLTSANYQDVGIGTAQGEGGQAYVLVFGVPGGAVTSNTARSGASGDSQAAEPPSAIVGYDEVGNIQYELQAGDTLGQILLLFGYTWDDLNAILELNGLTEEDITSLDIGQIVLVPPPQGTYTPTPEFSEATEEITPEVSELVSESTESVGAMTTTAVPENAQAAGIIPTPAPNSNNEDVTTLSEAAPIEALGQPVTFVAVTQSTALSDTPSPVATLAGANLPASTSVALAATESSTVIIAEPRNSSASSPPLWLLVAIVIQVGVLIFASVEFTRRRGH